MVMDKGDHDVIINRIKSIDHLSFWTYNRYVSNYTDGKIESYYTQDIPMDRSVYWSDLEKIKSPDLSDTDNIYIMHNYCQMSDYGGSLVEKSNTDILTSDYGFILVTGGYGSISCIIAIDALLCMPEEESERILDVLEGLEKYPLLDDDELFNQESKYIEEAWNNWAEYDFKRGIEGKFNIDLDDYEFKDIDVSFQSIFDEMAERVNEYWINESGYDMWINVDKIVDEMTTEDFNQYFKKVDE